VKVPARAHRWKGLLESGRYVSLSDQASAERIDRSYLGKMLRLTLLAPDIVAEILRGRQPPDLSMAALIEPMSVVWAEQRLSLLSSAAESSRSFLDHQLLVG
jgi:hypothetical protein